jgi:hypothetical protein
VEIDNEDIDKAWKREDERAERAKCTDTAGLYRVTPEGLIRIEVKVQGGVTVEIPHVLTNFSARIIGDVSRDDGAESTRAFEIEARVGERSFTFVVSAAQFAGMRWVTEHLGARAVVYAGQGTADHARTAIQLFSRAPAARTVYAHTGWRKLGEAWAYLHGGGAIGEGGTVADIEVSLPPELTAFKLGFPADPIAAIRASLKLLDLGPDRITVPAYGAIWRSILGDADFSVFLYGSTGVFKTELGALIQAHFGAGFNSRRLPTSFTSTANTNESLAFAAKDAVLMVDELHPPASGNEREVMHRDAARLLRSQGNAAGRGRMRADGTLRPPKPPRGLLLATGEELPRGQSVHARLFIFEIQRGDISAEKLTVCQQDAAAGLYAESAASFIRWLAPRLDDARSEFDAVRREVRAQVQHDHARTVDIRAQLTAALSIFIGFLLETGVIDDAEGRLLQARTGKALAEAADEQSQYVSGAEPTAAFLRLLASAIGAGSAHVADRTGCAPGGDEAACGWRSEENGDQWRAQGPRVGWLEGDDLYLDGDASYRAAQSMSAAGVGIEVSPITLWRRMRDKHLLVTTEKSRRTVTVRRTIEGRVRDVLHLSADSIGLVSSEADNADKTPGKRLPEGETSR